MMVFLSGGITGLPEEDAKRWRERIYGELKYSATVFDPAVKFDDDYDEFEIRDYDLYWLKKSDIVIVNFNEPKSIGTAQELAIARELRIPIVGILESNKKNEVHTWLKECCNKILYWNSKKEEKEEDGVDKAIDYVKAYYL